jgi:type IV pilus assembly protein PilB
MQINEEQLKKIILDSNLVTRTDIDEAIKKAHAKKQTLSDVLLSENKIIEQDLKKLEAFALGIPYVSLEKEKIDFSILSLIPEPIARNHNMVAYKKTDTTLEVAMLDVDDLPVIDFVKKYSGLKMLPRLTDSKSIKAVLVQYRKSLQMEFGDLIKSEDAILKKIDDEEDEKPTKELKAMAEDLPVVKIFDSLISHAVLQGASDIHIEPGEYYLLVRYRIDGILRDVMTLSKNAASGITARIKVLSNLKIDEKILPQDGRFKIEQNGEKISFRVSILPTFFGEKTVIRIFPKNNQGLTLEGLGFHGEGLERIHDALKQHIGMVLVTGPTGSGKTTTLYTMMDILNKPEVNISTIEDPVEYQMPRINQTQVKSDIGMTFANGLRSLLRQDPDIIMVGEIRDTETATLAVNAALTGHLVLSTIHTNSASGAIPRMIDMGILPFLLVSTLKTVIGQRLVRKLAESKTKYFLNKDEIKKLGENIDLERVLKMFKEEKLIPEDATWETVPFYKAVPSVESTEGYAGCLGIYEVLKISSTIKEIIIKGGTGDEIENQAKNEGMMTILEDGILQAVLGKTTLEEVLRVVLE